MMKLNPLCVNDNAASRQRLPPRVAKRPDPCQWSEDELMSLAEAAALLENLGDDRMRLAGDIPDQKHAAGTALASAGSCQS